MRRKQEGKPVTKKEREAENRRLAQLAAMEEQGVLCRSQPRKCGSKFNVVGV